MESLCLLFLPFVLLKDVNKIIFSLAYTCEQTMKLYSMPSTQNRFITFIDTSGQVQEKEP